MMKSLDANSLTDVRMVRLRLVLFAVVFTALSVGTPFAIYLYLGAQPITFDDRLLSWPVLGAAIGLLGIYFYSDGLRLYHTMKALGQALPRRHFAKLVFINILFSNITPMATGGGFAQIWYLRRHGVHLGTAIAGTTVRTLAAMAMIFALAPVLVYILPQFRENAVLAYSRILFVVFAFGYLGFLALVVTRTQWTILAIDGVLGVLHRRRLLNDARLRRWRFGARREVIRFSRGMTAYLNGRPADVAMSLGYTAVFLLALFSFPYLLLWGLGYQADYLVTTGVVVVATFIMYFAPTPGGAGFAEGVFGTFFASMVTPAELILVIVGWRFLSIYLGMLIGVPVTLIELAGWERRRA